MKQATIEEIRRLAKRFSELDKKWHFHILTPECQLNETGNYALVLENITDSDTYISYSDKPYMGTGEELVKLLHGADVMKGENEEKKSDPSEQVIKLLVRAKELIKEGVFWHHHMLFPKCKYNKHGDKWVIVFEDADKGEIIESISEHEPKNDLQHIEALFYSQKK